MTSSTDSSSRTVTVAIVSWNTRELLGACLESLREDAAAGIADVWVVDNASSDGSPELVADGFPWAHLVASNENLGFGRAVNLVAEQTHTTWIAPANADTRVTPGALARLVSEGESDPQAAVIAPRLLLPDGTTQHSVYPFPSIPFTLAYTSGLTRLSERLARHWCIGRGFDPDRSRRIAWSVGAFMVVRRAAWNEVGGFDAAHWMYAEDLDLGWRLNRAGWTARYSPDAHVFHTESASTTRAWGDARHAQWHASTYAWLLRRRGIVKARTVAMINVAGFLMRAAALTPATLLGRPSARDARRSALTAAGLHRVGLRSRRFLEAVK